MIVTSTLSAHQSDRSAAGLWCARGDPATSDPKSPPETTGAI